MESLLLLVVGYIGRVLGQPFAHSSLQHVRDANFSGPGRTFQIRLEPAGKAPTVNLRLHALQGSAFALHLHYTAMN